MIFEYHHYGKVFKELLSEFRALVDEEKKEKENEFNEELIKDMRFLFNLLNKHFFESVLKPEGNNGDLYKFIMEDRNSRKVKYIGIGPLMTTRVKFLRIRYKYELSICLNETNEEELFYNTNAIEFEEIVKEKNKGKVVELDW